MAIAEHAPDKLKGKKPDMTQRQLHDFAATPRTGLPSHVPARDASGGDVLKRLAGG